MKVTVAEIQHATARYYGLSFADMKAPCRARRYARPRQIAMALSRELTPRSLPGIGALFGGRDHTTVLHAQRRVAQLVAEQPEIASDIAKIKTLMRLHAANVGHGFNVLSLYAWLGAASRAGVAYVPAELVTAARIADLAPGAADVSEQALSRRQAVIGEAAAAARDGHILRWDHTAPRAVRLHVLQGFCFAPGMAGIALDDARAQARLLDQPQRVDEIALWRRPWIAPAYLGGFPVAYRVFVSAGRIAGIANRYPQRDATPSGADAAQTVRELRLCYDAACRIVAAIVPPLINPQLARAGLPLDAVSGTLDFLILPKGEAVFLDGGAPHIGSEDLDWGAAPCCFDAGHIEGIALSKRTRWSFERIGRNPPPHCSSGSRGERECRVK